MVNSLGAVLSKRLTPIPQKVSITNSSLERDEIQCPAFLSTLGFVSLDLGHDLCTLS